MALLNWEDNRPEPDEYGDFYEGYVNLVDEPNVIQSLIQQGQKVYALIQQLTGDEANHRYADDKWSVKEIIGHLVDTERIMAYRALCISRGEQTALPGYDHESYVERANFDKRSLQSLSIEYDALRNANISMFNSFSKEQMLQKGTANGVSVSVRAIAFIIAGHEKHHLNILGDKYGITIVKNGND
ncbi:damage-inducible protein DinB [Aliifodinibius salipaludis]|uniref:Damage-inducible protein DinB n=1 Tax=Fodinibius salipaludis TaxID=2032627 RepID=A0A2A2G6V2_9BACT|nr:DinB family protein [Aliifodinibius salipaludis]PAU93496.1 damage-inducible protein DinB [Aliifodinibius salipaludis]